MDQSYPEGDVGVNIDDTKPEQNTKKTREKRPTKRSLRTYTPKPCDVGTPREIRRNTTLSPRAALLGVEICELATNRWNRSGLCYASDETLAEVVGCAVSTLQDLKDELREYCFQLPAGIRMAPRFYGSKDGFGGDRAEQGPGPGPDAGSADGRRKSKNAPEKVNSLRASHRQQVQEGQANNDSLTLKTLKGPATAKGRAEQESGKSRDCHLTTDDLILRDPFADDVPEEPDYLGAQEGHDEQEEGQEGAAAPRFQTHPHTIHPHTRGLLATIVSIGDDRANLCKYEAVLICLERMRRLDVPDVAFKSTANTRRQGNLKGTQFAHWSDTCMKLAARPVSELHRKSPARAEKDWAAHLAAEKRRHGLPASLLTQATATPPRPATRPWKPATETPSVPAPRAARSRRWAGYRPTMPSPPRNLPTCSSPCSWTSS